jgi:hypothetical protein
VWDGKAEKVKLAQEASDKAFEIQFAAYVKWPHPER